MTWHPDMPDDYKNAIITGDARVLAERIPDASVDLIFTDPVYDRIDDYRWLAETAARVLRPDSACLVWYGGPRYVGVLQEIEKYLRYVWTLQYVVPAKPNKLVGYNIFTWTTPCLWFRKGKGFPIKRIPDTFISQKPPSGEHMWNKNVEVVSHWLRAFTQPGAVVYDPFTGGGTVPAVCKMLNRQYIAFEIDPATAARARTRVETTQAMHPMLLGVQEEMAL